MKKYLLLIASFILTLQIKAQTVLDVDGNTYNTVTIGTQVWMKENLKTTKLNNGIAIPNVTGATNYDNLNTGYSWYDNDAATYKNTYGALYNWYTVNTGKLCPIGWHVPDTAEWTTLITYLGGETDAGGKLKETGTTHWESPNTADNSTNFTALPGGWHDHADPLFRGIGIIGKWWSSKESGDMSAHYLYISGNSGAFMDDSYAKTDALSVRCLKDGPNAINTLNDPANNLIYPNPAKDKLYIDNNRLSDALIVIFDLQGKKIINIQTGINPIDISGLHNGVYIVKIIDSGKTIISKLIKE